FLCVVLSATVPTVASISPHTPVMEVTVALCELPSYVTLYGVTTTVAFALPTVSEVLPPVPAKKRSPAKLAAAPEAYGDPLTLYELPQSVTALLVATPLPLVTPLPAGLPFSVKLMVLPLTGFELEVRVAESVTIPP